MRLITEQSTTHIPANSRSPLRKSEIQIQLSLLRQEKAEFEFVYSIMKLSFTTKLCDQFGKKKLSTLFQLSLMTSCSKPHLKNVRDKFNLYQKIISVSKPTYFCVWYKCH